MMLVADRMIQRQASSDPLIRGCGRPLVPGRNTPAHWLRAPAWRCRPIPVVFALAIPAGVAIGASSALDLNPGCVWLDDALDIVFAVTVPEAEVSADRNASCASGCAVGTEGDEAVAGCGNSI
jgi:hypothetical protein